MMAIGSTERQPEAEKNGRRRRLRTPWLDSAGEEVEGVAAELTAVLARAGVAGVDGGVLGNHGGGGGRQGSI